MSEAKSDLENAARTLKEIEILAEVPPKKLRDLEKKCEWRTYDPGEIIIDLNDQSTGVYFLIRGRVKIMSYMAESQQVALAELGPNEAFGELSAIDLKVRSARVTAAEPTLLAELSSGDFRKLLIDSPQTALALLKRFSALIRTLSSRVTTLSTLSDHQRIYSELLRLSQPNTSGDGSWIIAHAPSHTDVASAAGTQREIVAEAIGNLVREGVIERKHKTFIIRDRIRMERLVNQ